MTTIYVDADASPVKNEVLRVARRYALRTCFVANRTIRIPEGPLIELIQVSNEADAADDWIVERVTDRDVAVTGDVPLAARCIKKGARVLEPTGRILAEDTIGEALAHRDLMTFLRDNGTMIGRLPVCSKVDRSRFLQRLDDLIQGLLRQRDER